MAVQVTRLREEAIIIAAIRPPVMWHFEIQEMFRRVINLRNTIDHSVDYFLILDTSELNEAEFTFSDMLYTLTEARRTVHQRMGDMIPHLLMVCPESLVALAEKSMFQAQYKNEEISVLETLDQALNVARMQLMLMSPG